MAQSAQAILVPELLIWARKASNIPLEQVAHKLGVSTERLLSWESGEERPTIKQARRLASIYRQPFAAFYLPQPPIVIQPQLRDYRRFPGTSLAELPPAIHFEIREASDRRLIALELLEEAGMSPYSIEVVGTLDEDPELLATTLRNALNVNYEEQTRWRDARLAFNYWRSVLEDSGVFVFQSSRVELHHMRGFSIGDFPLPVVVVNRKDAYAARTFTMLHELGHILLRTSGICDLDERAGRSPEEHVTEIFCNHLAGATLVPASQFLKEDIVRDKNKSIDWQDEEVKELSLRYGVSREVILRRLLILDLTSEEFYQTKREELIKQYKLIPKKQGFAPPPTETVSTAGKAFIRLVLDSFSSGKITTSDVVDYLGVRLKHMNKVREAVIS